MPTRIDHNSPGYRAASLGALLAKRYPRADSHAIGLLVAQMQAATRRAKAFAESCCSDEYLGSEDDPHSRYSRCQRAQDRELAAINGTLQNPRLWPASTYHEAIEPVLHPAYIKLGGDPRGPCGSLHFPPDFPGDGWAGEGYAIY